MSTVRGLRNNNPGNIRINNDRFEGEITPSSDRSFKQFKTMAHGYRAIMVTIRTYATKYHINTIEGIISRWAPPCENNTKGYIRQVALLSEMDAKTEIDPCSRARMVALASAIAQVENGVPAVRVEVEEGFNLYVG